MKPLRRRRPTHTEAAAAEHQRALRHARLMVRAFRAVFGRTVDTAELREAGPGFEVRPIGMDLPE